MFNKLSKGKKKKMCSLIQKYRCQVREYLQSMYLGTGSPSGPQVTASTPGWSSLRLWDKDGLALSLPTLCSPETPRSGDSHRQPTPKGASRLPWETSPSNSLKQAGFKQKAALFFSSSRCTQICLIRPPSSTPWHPWMMLYLSRRCQF